MKFTLLEEIILTTTRVDTFHNIYKNPSASDLNSKEDSKHNRAILDSDGNMYLEAAWDRQGNAEKNQVWSFLIHNTLLDLLQKEKGLFKGVSAPEWYHNPELLKKAVFIQRKGSTKVFALAESYDEEVIIEGQEIIQEMFKKALVVAKKSGNPYCEFVAEWPHSSY